MPNSDQQSTGLVLELLRRRFPVEVGSSRPDDSIRKAYDRRHGHLDVLHWDGRHRDVTGAIRRHEEPRLRGSGIEPELPREWLRQYFLHLPDDSESVSATDLSGNWTYSRVRGRQFSADLDAILDAYRAFERDMHEHGWMDFADQKLRPLIGLRQSPGLWSSFRHNRRRSWLMSVRTSIDSTRF